MGDRERWRAAKAGLLLLGLGLVVVVVALIVVSTRGATAEGRDQEECRNASLLLFRAQGSLKQAEDQAGTCNRTLVTLATDLERKNSENRKQQEQIQGFREEIMKLSQKLQDTLAQLEQIRTPKEVESTTRKPQSSAASSLDTPGLLVTSGLLLLGLGPPLP